MYVKTQLSDLVFSACAVIHSLVPDMEVMERVAAIRTQATIISQERGKCN